MMTSTTTGPAVPIEGTHFRLVPLRIEWEDHRQLIIHDYAISDQSFDDHHMLGLHSEFHLGHHGYPDPKDLPVCGEAEPEVAWTIRAPEGRGCFPVFWRQDDAVWMAKQLHAAAPEVWALPDLRAQRAAEPEGIAEWLGLIPPLLNAGCPRELLLSCKEYVEAFMKLEKEQRLRRAALLISHHAAQQ
jgi:hypothetical protein